MSLFRIVAALVAGACLLPAQTPQNDAGQPSTIIRLNKKEVVLDVVVRDKHGHMVNDLSADDIAVYEDGVQQKLTSFQNVQGREQLDAERTVAQMEQAKSAVVHPLNSLREVNFVSIVFAPMRQDNLAIAREAVQQFLKHDVLPNTYVTVFRLDATLRLVQPYTHDKPALLAAVDRVTKGLFLVKSGSSAGSEVVTTPSVLASSPTGLTASNGPTGPPSAQAFTPNDTSLQRSLGSLDTSQAPNAALQAEVELQNRLRFTESYATGMTVLDQIEELVRSQSRLPGRKVVLYLSDGLQLPMDRHEVFADLVSAANRSEVTFYTVDTRGLTTTFGPQDNPINSSISQLNRAVQGSQSQAALTRGNSGGAEGISGAFDAARAGDDVQLLAVSNTQLALEELAVRTGGFPVANTNELAKPMERVMEDIRTHYEVAYTPSSDVYDGHFRKIEVKVDRPKVTVQSRGGYFALPDLNGQPLQPFEMAALKAMNLRPGPQDVTYEAALLQFRPSPDGVQCEVAFEVPLSRLKAKADEKAGRALMQAFLVALVQDGDGQVINKVSRQLFRTVPIKDLGTVQKESIVYAEPINLLPGHYTVSTAVTDGGSNAIGVKRISTFVKPLGQLAVSSLQVVKRVSAVAREPNPADPFETKAGRITPSLTSNSETGKPVDLYFVVYPKQDPNATAPKLVIDLLKDGRDVTRLSPELPDPDESGAVPVLAELKPEAGDYDVRVTVTQGSEAAQASLALAVR